MTKSGYKQILVSIDTWNELKTFSATENKSIDGVLKGFLYMIRNQQTEGSNPSDGLRLNPKFELIGSVRKEKIVIDMAGNHNEIEKRLWPAADELRANSKLKSSEYSVPVLGRLHFPR